MKYYFDIEVKNLKDLGISLNDLYDNKAQINIHLSDKPYRFHVVLKDMKDKIDCKLSSFGANLWTRTNKGINYDKYTRMQDLQTALKKSINTKVDTNGDITFSLSELVCEW